MKRALEPCAEIAERQRDKPAVEGSDIVKHVREARAGAMYGRDRAE